MLPGKWLHACLVGGCYDYALCYALYALCHTSFVTLLFVTLFATRHAVANHVTSDHQTTSPRTTPHHSHVPRTTPHHHLRPSKQYMVVTTCNTCHITISDHQSNTWLSPLAIHGCHHLLSWHHQASPRPGGVVGVLEEHNPPCMHVKNGRSVLQFVAKMSESDILRTNDAE